MPRARDVMSTMVVTIPEDATVEDAIRTLLEHRISGAPITDGQGNLVGIISELHLLEAIYRPEVKREQVRALMSEDVISVAEGASLSEVANLFLLHRIRRVPVVHKGVMVGIISRRDLLQWTVAAGDPHDEQARAVKTYLGAR